MALLHLNFGSFYLRSCTDVNIILPDWPYEPSPEEFYSNGKKYPVLWLLHGGFDDYSSWVRKSNIELYATENQIIVVMPSAINSAYCNWENFGGGYCTHDYIIHELMPLVYNWFPASRRREDNFMAGLSMGGQGTWKFAVNYPEKFAACAMLSAPAFNYPEKIRQEKAKGGNSSHIDLINAYGGLDKFMETRENTRGVAKALYDAGKIDTLPRLYASWGDKDEHVDEFIDTINYFKSLGVEVEHKEYKGYAHEWRFWDMAIQDSLNFFGFNCPKRSPEE